MNVRNRLSWFSLLVLALYLSLVSGFCCVAEDSSSDSWVRMIGVQQLVSETDRVSLDMGAYYPDLRRIVSVDVSAQCENVPFSAK